MRGHRFKVGADSTGQASSADWQNEVVDRPGHVFENFNGHCRIALIDCCILKRMHHDSASFFDALVGLLLRLDEVVPVVYYLDPLLAVFFDQLNFPAKTNLGYKKNAFKKYFMVTKKPFTWK